MCQEKGANSIGTFFLDLKLAFSAEELICIKQFAVVKTAFADSFHVG